MKKVLCALAVLFLALALGACGAAAPGSAATDASATAQPPLLTQQPPPSSAPTSLPEPTPSLSPEQAAIEGANTIEELNDVFKQFFQDGDYVSALLAAEKMLFIDPAYEPAYFGRAEASILWLKQENDRLNGLLQEDLTHVNDKAAYARTVKGLSENLGLGIAVPFAPDYVSKDEITNEGIQTGNLLASMKVNGWWTCGLLTWQSDWVYFSDVAEGFALYKMRADGTELQRIGQACGSGLNIVGEWLYYANANDEGRIYKVRTDGEQETKISDDSCAFMCVSNGWIYFDGGALYKIRTDGSDRTQVTDAFAIQLCVSGEWIFFFEKREEGGLWRVRTDGSERALVAEGHPLYCVQDNWLFLVEYEKNGNNVNVLRTQMDGSEQSLLYTSERPIAAINVSGDFLFFTTDAYRPNDGVNVGKRIDVLDMRTMQVTSYSNLNAAALCVDNGGSLYYVDWNDKMSWHRIDLATGEAVNLK